MNIIKQKVRNLLFSIQTTGTAKHLVHIRINKQSAPVIGYANRAYSSLVYSRPFSEMPKQNWRFCCSGNPKIHVIVSRKSFQTYTTKILIPHKSSKLFPCCKSNTAWQLCQIHSGALRYKAFCLPLWAIFRTFAAS